MSRSCQSATSLEPGLRGCREGRGRARRAARSATGCACGASRSSPSARPSRTAPAPRRPRCAAGGALRARTTRSTSPAPRTRRATRRERSRAITWVDGAGRSPSCSHTYASTCGSTLEYVPTAPDTLPTATASRARSSRTRSRRSCSAQSASLLPKVMGSAWIPCVRPAMGVSRCSRARRDDGGLEPVDLAQDQIAGPHQGDGQAGVDDVVGREPVVHPLGGGAADALLHDVDEGGGLVIGDRLPRSRIGRRASKSGALPDRRRVGAVAPPRAWPRPPRRAPRPRARSGTGPRR